MNVIKSQLFRNYEMKRVSKIIIEWLSAIIYADAELPEKLQYVISVNTTDHTISNLSSSIKVHLSEDLDEKFINEVIHMILPDISVTPIESMESSDNYLLDYSAMLPLFKFIKARISGEVIISE